jgi:hypothetical protein
MRPRRAYKPDGSMIQPATVQLASGTVWPRYGASRGADLSRSWTTVQIFVCAIAAQNEPLALARNAPWLIFATIWLAHQSSLLASR